MKFDGDTALRLAGMKLTDRAIIGPEVVQIDLTDTCRNNCIGCWARSPFLRDEDHYDTLEKGVLDHRIVFGLIPQLPALRVREVFLGGGGDPSCYPHLVDVVRRIKEAGMRCTLNTSFVGADEKLIDGLCDVGLDHLIASVWAGNGTTYAKLHPNKSARTFDYVTSLLQRIAARRRAGYPAPTVKIYQVVLSLNHREIGEMIECGRRTDADEVELSVFDPIPGRTSMFSLNPSQIATVDRFFETFRQEGLPFVHKDLFLRRLHNIDVHKGVFDNGIVASIPCASGWFFARVTTMGRINGCLKAHRIPTGNIKETPLEKIWYSEAHNEFRRQTIQIRHDNPYLDDIGHDIKFGLPGCFRICDNIGANQGVMMLDGGLSQEERDLVDRLVMMAESGATREELVRVSEGRFALPKEQIRVSEPSLTLHADIDVLHDHFASSGKKFSRVMEEMSSIGDVARLRIPLGPQNLFRLAQTVGLIAMRAKRRLPPGLDLDLPALPLETLPERVGPFLDSATAALKTLGVDVEPDLGAIRDFCLAASKGDDPEDDRLRAVGAVANRAFAGPRTFHLDVMNACNSDCVQCWFHSPFSKDRADAADFGSEWKKQVLDFETFAALADDLAILRAGRDVVLSGKGEPLLHPRVVEMVRYLKRKDLFTTLFTNGLALDEPVRRACVESGCDLLYVSLSADSEETYARLHQQPAAGEFARIVKNVSELSALKKSLKKDLPKIVLVNVICNRNAASVLPFAELAGELGAEMLRYQLTAIEPYNRTLALSPEDLARVTTDAKRAREIAEKAGIHVVENFDLQLDGADQNWSGEKYLNAGCLAGYAFSRAWAGGEISFCCSPKVIGSLHATRFADLWNSPEYDQARTAAKYMADYRDFTFRNGRCLFDEVCTRCPNYEGLEHLRGIIDRMGLRD